MAERCQRRSVARLQPGEQCLARGDEVALARARCAIADVECEYQSSNRDVRRIDELDCLGDAVITELEVGRGEAGRGFAPVGHQCVYADSEGVGAEGRLLGSVKPAREEESGHCRERERFTLRHCSSIASRVFARPGVERDQWIAGDCFELEPTTRLERVTC